MTFRRAVLGVGMLWLAAVAIERGVDAQGKTVWDGVYSEEQATRGQAAYEAECASCHQPDFAGDGFAPGLAGPEFASAWNDLSVGDLFDRVRQSMPPSNPGSVPPASCCPSAGKRGCRPWWPAGRTRDCSAAWTAGRDRTDRRLTD
ncbi:MAG TPA: c-type cytochrome, partial [Vicinamibacterales bacterium]|nr:c-type cytochrome [Vicinamibacterales bacterium]